MDPAVHTLMLDHAAAQHDAKADAGTWCMAHVPYDGTDLDGAVVELQLRDDGIFTAEVRIPGPPAP